MPALQYLDKRDERGVILRYSAHELAYELSYKALTMINSTDVYNILVNAVPKKYIDLFYLKMIYEELLPIVHQLVIYRHDKINYGKSPVNFIDCKEFPCQALLGEIIKSSEMDLSILDMGKRREKTKDHSKPEFFRETLKGVLHALKNRSNPSKSFNPQNVFIGFNYFEGFDIRKRSDLFWYFDSGIDPSSIIVYFESPEMMIRHDYDQTAESYFFEQGFNQVKLWEWKQKSKNKYFENLNKKVRSYNATDEISLWLKRNALSLCKESSFWSSFFDGYGIKIHLDATMSGLTTIIKQIAINQLGGCSIGKLRSYPTNLKGSILGYYPNDVVFTWGIDSSKRIHENNKHINNILISGFPYKSSVCSSEKQLINKKSTLETKKNGKLFNILILDTNNGLNDGLSQVIQKSAILEFYQNFLDWVRDDKEIGIIIKPKKSIFLNDLPEILRQIDELEKHTNRCVLIRNSFQKMSTSYLRGIDMVVGASVFFPSSIVECVIYGSKAINYDYSNIKFHEDKLYKWGENKVIFHSLKIMFNTLKKYKDDPSANPDLGDWTEHLDELDPFRDERGGERIGTYMRCLHQSFVHGKNRDLTINTANKYFEKEYMSHRLVNK